MTEYELYTFLLCFIVFVIFVVIFSIMLTYICKLSFIVIRNGINDSKIITEYYDKLKNKNKDKIFNIISKVSTIAMCSVFIVLFVISMVIGSVSNNKNTTNISIPKVVQTQSMSYALKTNEYLTKNNLTNQFKMFDIVFIDKLPNVEDLKLYDIVVYEAEEDVYVIHRIVGIEKPNDKHDEYYFRLQGDAVQSSDKYPVTYEQMKGIYNGTKIKFLGSFIMFLQSPAGWLCIILILFYLFGSPLLERKINKEIKERLIVNKIIES